MNQKKHLSSSIRSATFIGAIALALIICVLLPERFSRLQQIPSINFTRKQKRKERLRFMRRCRRRPCRLFRLRS